MLLFLSLSRLVNCMYFDPDYEISNVFRSSFLACITYIQSQYNFKSSLSFHIALYSTKNIILLIGFQSVLSHSHVTSLLATIALQKLASIFDSFTFLYLDGRLLLNIVPYIYFYVRIYFFYESSTIANDLTLFIFSALVAIMSDSMHHRFIEVLFTKIQQTKDLEMKWYNTLMNIPCGVTLY